METREDLIRALQLKILKEIHEHKRKIYLSMLEEDSSEFDKLTRQYTIFPYLKKIIYKDNFLGHKIHHY